jgi:hypothetical protein
LSDRHRVATVKRWAITGDKIHLVGRVRPVNEAVRPSPSTAARNHDDVSAADCGLALHSNESAIHEEDDVVSSPRGDWNVDLDTDLHSGMDDRRLGDRTL